MAKKRRPPPPPVPCANCGEDVPAGRRACPHCGSDADTGWKDDEEVGYAAADVPDAFDEDDYRAAVDGIHAGRPALWSRRQVRIFVIGALLLAALIVPALIALARMRR